MDILFTTVANVTSVIIDTTVSTPLLSQLQLSNVNGYSEALVKVTFFTKVLQQTDQPTNRQLEFLNCSGQLIN